MIVTDLTSYWDRYAGQLTAPAREEALKKALRWCQYDDHGPGPELLGEPESALELGCGRGDAVAALASTGVEATGVDLSGSTSVRPTSGGGMYPAPGSCRATC